MISHPKYLIAIGHRQGIYLKNSIWVITINYNKIEINQIRVSKKVKTFANSNLFINNANSLIPRVRLKTKMICSIWQGLDRIQLNMMHKILILMILCSKYRLIKGGGNEWVLLIKKIRNQNTILLRKYVIVYNYFKKIFRIMKL
jgi:hypothetical protein